MTSQVSTKVRLVRCPKCRQVLAELPDVLLYKCGGCGTVLQGKNRKKETNHTELSLQEPVSVAKSHQDNVSEENEARSPNHDLISQKATSSDEISSSPELNTRCDEDSPTEVKESLKQEHEKTLGQTSETFDGKFHDHKNSHEHENEESGLRPRAAYRERMQNNNIPLENDEKSRNCDTIPRSPEQSIQADDEVGYIGTFKSSSPDKDVSANVEDAKSLVSFYLSSPDVEYSDKKLTRNFASVSSVDTLGSSPLEGVSSELGLKDGDGTNEMRNASYYAYDGSESSFDGTDDQISKHISHPSRRFKDSDYTRTNEGRKKDGIMGNDVADSKREMNYWSMNSHAMKSRDIGGNQTRLDKQGFGSSGLRFTSRAPVSCPRTENPSSYRPNLPPVRPRFRSSVEPSSYTQPDNMDLLRTVCELKDQLTRMHFPTNRRFPSEEFAPSHHNPGGYDLPRCQGWSTQQHNVPRMAFSGEAAHFRHQVNCSCLNCCRQDWHYSAQLPPPNCMHCRNDHCRVPTEHYTSSDISLHGCETKFEDHRQQDDEMKRVLLKEKYNTAKRYLRPVTGGAPFVSCYHCSELLQLPADFLFFKKRYHQLMCKACRKVLKFSVLDRTHIVPYSNDDTSAPPPSEAGDYNDNTTRRNLEPVSSFDDYRQSYCQSRSTSFDKVERNAYNRKMSLGSIYEPVEDRKMKSISRDSPNNNNIAESVGTSSKIPKWRKTTSGIESSKSPLHRLMGYASPSHVSKK